MIKEQIKNLIEKSVRSLYSDIQDKEIYFTVEHPADLSHGDYSSNVSLILSKKLGLSPKEVAEKIILEINKSLPENILKVNIAGPGFINFYFKNDFFLENIKKIITNGEKFGSSELGKNKKVLVDYSGPNIAKPFTVGHLRSTIIGDVLANILVFLGYKVIRDNHLGDWGTQFGKQMVAIEKWGSLEALEKSENKVKYLVDLYVKFHEESEKDISLEDLARNRFADLERGEKKAREMYDTTIKYSLEYFDSVYKRLKVNPFDTTLGESFYREYMKGILDELEKRGVARESEGALAVFFNDEKFPPFLIRKANGSTLYATSDLASDKYRLNTYGDDLIIINETGTEQILHFKQLFETEKMLGWIKDGQRVHISHGMYRFKEGKMSTRKGNVIWLEEIIDEAVNKAREINSDVAEEVAISAIKFNDLKRESKQDINFDWKGILDLRGDSGPYLQYYYARANSVLEKAKNENIKAEIKIGKKDAEQNEEGDEKGNEISHLEKIIYYFPEVVERAGKEYSPHYIATYLIEIAGAFNSFYAKEQIVNRDDENSAYRVAITKAFSIVMKNGLNLLGIPVLEKM
ncbi:MAG: arginine--tRNA ligase [bacterium]|nr:arginine--tRNA ligase [bacterium]